MGSEDRALRVKARETRRTADNGTAALPHGPAHSDARAEREREAKEYAPRAMISSAQAHDRAARLLEQMAGAHPEEAELHLQAASRHRRWAENDRKLAERYAPRGGGPDGS